MKYSIFYLTATLLCILLIGDENCSADGLASRMSRETAIKTFHSSANFAWKLKKHCSVAILHTRYTDVAYYVPANPKRLLILAHGYPWDDGSVSGSALTNYAKQDVTRWSVFAEQNNVIIMAPAFGGKNFVHYGQMLGRLIRPDQFINELVDGPAAKLIPNFEGKFNLHGHSAGAQFAARYAIMHPERMDQVILSAPSTYPMPDTAQPWPYGIGRTSASVLLSLVSGKSALKEKGSDFKPNAENWLSLASSDAVTVLVGSKDLEVRPPAPGQRGSNRLTRAKNWIASMQKFASSHGRTSHINMVVAEGLDHDEAAIATPAQNIFFQRWHSKATDSLIGSDSIKWLEDLAFYREQMAKTHGNLFHTMTRQQFNDSISVLEKNISRLTANEAKTAIMRLVAMVNDGHTRVRLETLGEHSLPIRLYYFDDGLYVEAAEKKYQNIIGGKVEKIGTMRAEEVYLALRNLIPVDGDNEYRRRLMTPGLMVNPEILQSIGATETSREVKITVQQLDHNISVDLPAGEFQKPTKHGWPVDGPDWINARTLSRSVTPLWLQHSDKAYWATFLPDGKTLYIQYNEVANQDGAEPIAKFFPSLIKEAEKKNVERIVLDLRLNSGGNNELNRPIWHALIKSDHFNKKGKLWVITGPKTFSAAMDFVDEVELNTQAIFIGQPTGETPNQWGDPRDIKLPNSGIVVQASTLWWQLTDPRDDRSYLKPDIMVGMSFSDYKNGVDPVLSEIERESR